jgi:diaminopimelate decarboxylase
MKKNLPKPLHYKKNQLYFDHLPVSEIAAHRATPFYLYSEQTIIQQAKTFLNEAKKAGLKNSLVCFALKANSNKEIIKLLKNEGIGADIVSLGELFRAKEAKVEPNKIIFSGVGKTELEIKMALKSSQIGVYAFNVESVQELALIGKCAREIGKEARVSFRLNPEVNAKTHKHISTGDKIHKFGMTEEDILAAVKDSYNWDYCKLVGLSIHIGSQLTELNATDHAIHKLIKLAEKINWDLEFLDVGGGLGIDYHESETDKIATIQEYMQLVGKHFKLAKKIKCLKNIRILFEPGRILVARSGVLVTKVIRTKTTKNQRFLVIDGGMNDLIRPSLYSAYHKTISHHLDDKEKLYPTEVVGPVCETSDCFGSNRMLPQMNENDLLIIADTGAYGYSMSSNYNMRGKPEEVLLTKNGAKTINKAQTYSDIT